MTIAIFGASITYGAKDLEKGGWVNRLRLNIEQQSDDFNLVYNFGVPGDTTRDLLGRMETELRSCEPDVVIVSIGINDSAFLVEEKRQNVDQEAYAANLKKIFDLSRQYAKRIAFVALTPVDEARTQPVSWINILYSNEVIDTYNKTAARVCVETGAEFIDIWTPLLKSDYQQTLIDGVHPDHRGHEMIFSEVKKAMAL